MAVDESQRLRRGIYIRFVSSRRKVYFFLVSPYCLPFRKVLTTVWVSWIDVDTYMKIDRPVYIIIRL